MEDVHVVGDVVPVRAFAVRRDVRAVVRGEKHGAWQAGPAFIRRGG